MPTDPLTEARAALAEYDAPACGKTWTVEYRDEDGPGVAELECDRPVGHMGECDPTPRRRPHPNRLRAALAEADRLRALLTPPPNATRLPHEWPTDTRDPLVCTHGCGAEPGDVLVEDECPRRLRRALDAAGGEPGITWDEALHTESAARAQAMAAIVRLGHTEHCAARLAYGDGECECRPTDAERVDLARLCEEATPGPWAYRIEWGGSVYAGARSIVRRDMPSARLTDADLAFIAAARTALPRLLAALAAAEGERDRLRRACRVALAEFSPWDGMGESPAPDVALDELRAALAAAKETK